MAKACEGRNPRVKYETSVSNWTCTCGQQKYDRHHLCKHLVQAVAPRSTSRRHLVKPNSKTNWSAELSEDLKRGWGQALPHSWVMLSSLACSAQLLHFSFSKAFLIVFFWFDGPWTEYPQGEIEFGPPLASTNWNRNPSPPLSINETLVLLNVWSPHYDLFWMSRISIRKLILAKRRWLEWH